MQLPVTKLPRTTQEMLEEILQKTESSISEDERDFLRARRDYLTGEQKAFYKVEQEVEKNPVTTKLNEETKTVETVNEEKSEDTSPMTKPQLKAELRKLEVEFDETASKDELNELLKEAKANL